MLKVAMHRFLLLDFPTRAASDLDPRTGRASRPRSARRTRAWPREHALRATASAAFVRAIFMNHDMMIGIINLFSYNNIGCVFFQSLPAAASRSHRLADINKHSDFKTGCDWSNFRISPTLSHRR